MGNIYKKGNSFTVLEEGDSYLTYPSNDIRKFVQTARNRGIGAFVSVKRAKSIRPVYRTRFTHLVIFRVNIPEDIRYLEEWAGIEKGSLNMVRNLDVGHHVIVDLMNNTVEEMPPI